MSTDIIIPTPLKVFDEIESIRDDVIGLACQLDWHADLLKMATQSYIDFNRELNLSGLQDLMAGLSKQLHRTSRQLFKISNERGSAIEHQAAATA